MQRGLLPSWSWFCKQPHLVTWGVFGGALCTVSYGKRCSLAQSPQRVNAPVLLDCFQCVWAATGKARTSVGPTVFDLGMELL